MRFLHVSTGDHRGAFSGAYRLHRNLIDCGHESFMFVGRKTVDDPTVVAPAQVFQSVRYFLEKVFSLLAKRIFGKGIQASRIFKVNFGFVPTFEVVRKLDKVKPDLVIVYYVADFLSEKQLHRIQEITKAPIVFYLMDMGMLTGGCHYAWDCKGYHKNCADCPVVSSNFIKKLILKKWESRKVHYKKINPIIVSGSEQLSQQVALSSLTRSHDLKKILMGVSSETYNPLNREASRKELGFSTENIVLYFGAQNVDDKRKGFSYLVEAINLLVAMLLPNEVDNILLFTIGNGDPIGKYRFPFRHLHLSFIADQEKFSKTYSAADVFICSSVEDSGPMMINESMMSGTPVIAFDVGVAKDLVIDGKTGYKVSAGNSLEFASALAQFVKMTDEQRVTMRENCRKLALQTSSVEKQVESFVQLASQLSSRKY